MLGSVDGSELGSDEGDIDGPKLSSSNTMELVLDSDDGKTDGPALGSDDDVELGSSDEGDIDGLVLGFR